MSRIWARRAITGRAGKELLHSIPAASVGVEYQENGMMNLVAVPASESYSVVGSCINCTTPASLMATMTLVAIGVAFAIRAERRNGASRRA